MSRSNKKMQHAWRQWHGDMPLEEMPIVNLSFERAWNIQQAHIDEQQQIINDLEHEVKLLQQSLKTTKNMLGSAITTLEKVYQ